MVEIYAPGAYGWFTEVRRGLGSGGRHAAV
jgi:hypothetical protein